MKSKNKEIIFHKYSDIENHIKLFREKNEGVLFKHLSLYKENLLDILYNEEKIITIEYEDCKQNLSELFYLDRLINAKKSYVNISYSFDFIQKINNDNIKSNEPLRKIIISKIILNLLNNFKGLDIYNEKYESEIENLEIDNILLIEYNFFILKNEIQLEYGVKSVIEMEVDYLYIEIIYILLYNKKFEDY